MADDPFVDDIEDVTALDPTSLTSTPVADTVALHRAKKPRLRRPKPLRRPSGRNAHLGLGETAAADRFLQRQTRMLEIQMEHLHEQRGLQLTHLRLRRLNEYLKLTLQALTICVGLAVVAVLGAMALQAHRDDAIVIDPFRAPPDLTQRGLDGATLATQFLDKLREMQESTDSARAASTFRNNWSEDIKVEIPETGVSIGDLQRYLRQVLGRETHITGEVVHGVPTRAGRTASAAPLFLTVRAGPHPAQKLSGSDADLDGMLQQAAEAVFSQTQPYRYIVYLARHSRIDEAISQVEKLASTGSMQDRAWALAYWGGLLLVKYGDIPAGEQKEEAALRLDPNLAIAWHNLAGDEILLGHDESGLRKLAGVRRLLASSNGQLSDSARDSFSKWAQVRIDELHGDYGSAAREDDELQADSARYGTSAAAVANIAVINAASALALAHDITASRRLAGSALPVNASAYRQVVEWGSALLPIISQRIALDDWKSVSRDFDTGQTAAAEFPLGQATLPVLVRPWLAYARAMTGDRQGAKALIATTPSDCYLCLRMRGKISAAEHDWNGAERWFTQAVLQGPSLPFAYADWGQMLAEKGDLNGAIRMFARARQAGPRFADPTELWGEALMQKGDYRGAVEKFAEAGGFAPRWGRLHLKWGEALERLGQRAGARQQYAAAAAMDLSDRDRARLALLQRGLGGA